MTPSWRRSRASSLLPEHSSEASAALVQPSGQWECGDRMSGDIERFEIETTPASDDIQFLDDRLYAFNMEATGPW